MLSWGGGDNTVDYGSSKTPLVDGGTYYVIPAGGSSYQLADSKCHATGLAGDCGGTAGPITPLALTVPADPGRSDSLVKQGDSPSADASATGPRTIAPGTSGSFRGVAVTATNSDDIATVGVSAAISGGVSIGVGGAVDIIGATTKARIGNSATVNCTGGSCTNSRANADQAVLVAAP